MYNLFKEPLQQKLLERDHQFSSLLEEPADDLRFEHFITNQALHQQTLSLQKNLLK